MSDVFNTILSDCLVLSDEDASAFARAHQLSAYTESDGADYRLERQVSQWVGGHFLCWEEHWLKENEQRALRLISPNNGGYRRLKRRVYSAPREPRGN